MILSLAAFAQLAAFCAPTVHVETLAAIARTESRFHVFAIGDNTARRSYHPATAEQAVELATALLRQGRSLDLGLMQVNSTNLPRLGLTVADAFDPCKSLAAGARVLQDGFRPAAGADAQPALRRALSHYNTGNPERGFANGYVERVQASAELVVPAIRLRGDGPGPAGGRGEASGATAPVVPSPPSWDVWGQARHRRQQGDAPRPAPAPEPAPPAPSAALAPVQLQALSRGGADVR